MCGFSVLGCSLSGAQGQRSWQQQVFVGLQSGVGFGTESGEAGEVEAARVEQGRVEQGDRPFVEENVEQGDRPFVEKTR